MPAAAGLYSVLPLVKAISVSLILSALWIPLAVGQTDTQTVAMAARLQTALDRNGYGVGLVDGKFGVRSRNALLDFAHAQGLSEKAARAQLLAAPEPPTVPYTVTQADWDEVGQAPADYLEASTVPRMACTSLVEVLSERFHVSEPYLQHLNPAIGQWNAAVVGASIAVPNVRPSSWHHSAARLEIDCQVFRIRAYDTDGTVVGSFPCSIARDKARVPTGELKLTAFAPNPNYTFDPAVFPESHRAQEIGRKLIIPPGPNAPVGVYWISISAPGFGIHGTPHPETIGRQESHGCFRMTNWDIVTLAGMVTAGTPVSVTGVLTPEPASAEVSTNVSATPKPTKESP